MKLKGEASTLARRAGISQPAQECATAIIMESTSPRRLTTLALLAAILLAGGALRFARLDSVPPGLWFDEALKAKDAVDTAAGQIRLVYPDVFPREPLFVWILSIAVKIAGPNIIALRATSALVGMLTILIFFGCVRFYAGDRIALFAAASLAFLRWHVIFSHLLFRTLLLPLCVTLIVWAAGRARERMTIPRVMLLGALIGGGFYTYLAWYFMFPGAIALIGWVFWGRLGDLRGKQCLAAALLSLLAVAAPIGIRYATEPELILARPGAISPFQGGPAQAAKQIGTNFLQVLGMFHYKGDLVSKQNIPGRPALDPIQGLFFLLGLILCLRRMTRRAAFETILVCWLALGLMPTVFSKTDSPNFLRTLVATPAVAGLVAIGFAGAWDGIGARLRNRDAMRFVPLVAILLLAGSFAITTRDVFFRWAKSEEAWEGFNGPFVQLARSALRSPEGGEFWMPQYLSEHRTFQFLAPDASKVHPYSKLDFLRRGADPGRDRYVVATAHNGVFPVLRELVPGGNVAEEYRTPEQQRTWALLYRIPAGSLPDPAAVEKAEQSLTADLRW